MKAPERRAWLQGLDIGDRVEYRTTPSQKVGAVVTIIARDAKVFYFDNGKAVGYAATLIHSGRIDPVQK